MDHIESFRILFCLRGKCEISKIISTLFNILVELSSLEFLSEVRIASTFLQAQMVFANYEHLIENFSSVSIFF